MISCYLVGGYRCFGRTCCLLLQGWIGDVEELVRLYSLNLVEGSLSLRPKEVTKNVAPDPDQYGLWVGEGPFLGCSQFLVTGEKWNNKNRWFFPGTLEESICKLFKSISLSQYLTGEAG